MNRKSVNYIAISACCIASTGLHAGAPQPFNGPYAGGQLGTQMTYANQTLNNNVNFSIDTLFSTSLPFTLSSNMKRNALIGSIFAGYGHTWNKFYISGEVALSNSTYKMTSAANKTLLTNFTDIITNASYETMNSEVNISPTQFGVFARPGLLLTPNSLLYARIGTSFAMLKTISTLFSTKQLIATSTTPPTVVLNEPITTQASVHARRAAFQIGGGIEQAINKKFTVRMDYLFSNYGTIKAQATQATVTPYPLTATTHQKIALRDQSIMLGLTYQFG